MSSGGVPGAGAGRDGLEGGGGGAIELHRGDMLLMLATSRHHGMPAPPGARDAMQGALFQLWTPNAKHRNHQPNTTELHPSPPLESLAVVGDMSSWDDPSVGQVLWLGKWATRRVGLWEGDVADGMFADAPEVPVFLTRSALADARDVLGVAEHSVLPVGGQQGRDRR